MTPDTFEITYWAITTLIVIICVVIFFVFLTVLLPEQEFVYDYEYINPSEWKTGDIIVLSYTHEASWFIRGIAGSKWVHLGIVWIDPEDRQIYILEGARYKLWGGPSFFKIDLPTWYKINRKNIIVRLPIRGRNVDPHNLLKEFMRFEKTGLGGFDLSWVRFAYIKNYTPEYDYSKRRTCIEVAIQTLQNAGIYKKEKSSCSFLAKQVVRRGIACEEGYSYDYPRYMFPGWYARGMNNN